MTNAEARFNKSLRPRKPEGSLGRTAQDVHLDSHTAPELFRALERERGEREREEGEGGGERERGEREGGRGGGERERQGRETDRQTERQTNRQILVTFGHVSSKH